MDFGFISFHHPSTKDYKKSSPPESPNDSKHLSRSPCQIDLAYGREGPRCYYRVVKYESLNYSLAKIIFRLCKFFKLGERRQLGARGVRVLPHKRSARRRSRTPSRVSALEPPWCCWSVCNRVPPPEACAASTAGLTNRSASRAASLCVPRGRAVAPPPCVLVPKLLEYARRHPGVPGFRRVKAREPHVGPVAG